MFDTLGLAGRIIKAGVKYAESGFQNVKDDVYDERLKVCLSCDKYDNDRCLECGCFLKLKARMATEKCPLDKWPNDKIIKPVIENHIPCIPCQQKKPAENESQPA